MTKTLDATVERLVEKYKLSDQQAAAIRSAIANFVVAAIDDPEIRKEAEEAVTEECKLFFEEEHD